MTDVQPAITFAALEVDGRPVWPLIKVVGLLWLAIVVIYLLYRAYARSQWPVRLATSETWMRTRRTIGICVFVATAAFAVAGMLRLAYFSWSLRWPVTEAIVTQSEAGPPQKVHRSIEPLIPHVFHYSYSVEGHRYVGSRKDFWSDNLFATNEMAAVVSNYPVGKTVTVHYNPNNPASSLLEPGPGQQGVMIFWWLIVLLPGSLLGARRLFQRRSLWKRPAI